VLQIFPFLSLVAPAASLVLLVMLIAAGEIGPRGMAVAVSWMLAAGYCQFFPASPVMSATGLALQTLLAVGLTVRWRLTT